MPWLNGKFAWWIPALCMLLTGLGHGGAAGREGAGAGAAGQGESGAVSIAAVQKLVETGNQALAAGNRFRAAVLFESAHRLGAPNEGLAATLGNIWYVEEDFRQALFWYEQALRQAAAPSPRLQLRRIEVLYRLGDYAAARTAGEALLAGLGPDDDLAPDVQTLLGYAAMQAGEKGQAVKCWQTALERKVQDPSILRFLGNYFAQNEDYAQALKYLRLQAARFPGDRETARQVVVCLMRLERMPEATAAMVDYLEYFAGDAQAEELLQAYIDAAVLQ